MSGRTLLSGTTDIRLRMSLLCCVRCLLAAAFSENTLLPEKQHVSFLRSVSYISMSHMILYAVEAIRDTGSRTCTASSVPFDSFSVMLTVAGNSWGAACAVVGTRMSAACGSGHCGLAGRDEHSERPRPTPTHCCAPAPMVAATPSYDSDASRGPDHGIDGNPAGNGIDGTLGGTGIDGTPGAGIDGTPGAGTSANPVDWAKAVPCAVVDMQSRRWNLRISASLAHCALKSSCAAVAA